MEEEEHVPTLSKEALLALQQFYQEQSSSSKIKQSIDETEENQLTNWFQADINSSFPEDWQMSQFWYDDDTSKFLANLVKGIEEDEYIACISCPSVFLACGPLENVHLFEYDKRFDVFESKYIFYDYNQPDSLPEHLLGKYSTIIADPPFLSVECLQKFSITIKKLLKNDSGRIILCTGSVMEDKALYYLGLKRISFMPKHKNQLGNEFACFTNFHVKTNN